MLISGIKNKCSAVLKEETKELHQQVELLLIPRIKSVQNRDDYAQILRLFYGYFAPLEHRIAPFFEAALLPDFPHRRKAGLLLQDLQHLGLNEEPVWCPKLPGIKNINQAWGALYVLEGSTLGGVHIAAMIRQKIQPVENVLAFFQGYGANTSTMWHLFKETLDISVSDARFPEVVAAANDTFLHLENWMQTFFDESEQN